MITPTDQHRAARRGSSTVQRINRRAAVILPAAGITIASITALAAAAPVALVDLAYMATYAGVMVASGWLARRICRRSA
jgi:hypothetical protein